LKLPQANTKALNAEARASGKRYWATPDRKTLPKLLSMLKNLAGKPAQQLSITFLTSGR
jgi:hypothetical protein